MLTFLVRIGSSGEWFQLSSGYPPQYDVRFSKDQTWAATLIYWKREQHVTICYQ